jgi:Flp pilus assembly protein protease CpaA
MDIVTLLFIWTAGLLTVGAYTDIRWREVPDWLNFAGIAAGLGTRAIYSLATGQWSYILAGLAGLVAALVVAYAMFYLGQWGGGDSKMLLALGALLGIDWSMSSYGVAFVVNVLLVGAAYGLIWSLALALIHRRTFAKEAVNLLRQPMTKWSLCLSVLVAIVFAVAAFFLPSPLRLSLALFAIAMPCIFFLGIAIKAVELGCMIRRVPPTVLTEGDWIVEDVVVDGKRITGPADLGVSIPQIKKLIELAKKRKLKTVLLKEGIPFVPSFLLGFFVTVMFGNLLSFFIP